MKPYCKEVKTLIKIFQQAEYELIREIYRQQLNGLVDYHTQAQLKRVQAILKKMQSESFKYIPKMVKEQFYMGKKASAIGGYANAMKLTTTGTKQIEELIRQMEDRVILMSLNAQNQINQLLTNAFIFGRMKNDIFRQVGLMGVAKEKATGGVVSAKKYIVNELRQHGITAFVDKAGKRWRLGVYGSMVSRTTANQSSTMGSIDNDKYDLVKMSSHYGSCPICAPLQDRVYSKSGKNPNYPPLAWAFAKRDKNGPDTLENSWMNIHPNCEHRFYEFNEKEYTESELKKIREFSSFTKNPISINPQSEREQAEYKNKLRSERRILNTLHQWERYRSAGINVGYDTFKKHKKLNDAKYKAWKEEYRRRNRR